MTTTGDTVATVLARITASAELVGSPGISRATVYRIAGELADDIALLRDLLGQDGQTTET